MGNRLVEKRVRRFYRRGEFTHLRLPLSQARGATPGGPRFRRTPAMRLRTGSAPSHPASPNSENAPPSTSPAAKFFFEKGLAFGTALCHTGRMFFLDTPFAGADNAVTAQLAGLNQSQRSCLSSSFVILEHKRQVLEGSSTRTHNLLFKERI